LAILIF